MSSMTSPADAPGSPSTADRARWSADWEVAVRVWIERQGKTLLGEGLADLLGAIEQTRSISAAARQIGISYRHAWLLVQGGNEAAGEPLVAAAVGGVKGGGAQLTPRGKLSLEIYSQLREQVGQAAAGLLQKTLSPPVDSTAAVHLAAAISLQEALGQLLTEYALRQPAVRVRAVYGASNELADHVLAGAPCDLFVSADPVHLDRLSAEHRLRPRSRRVVAANSLAVIGRDGLRKIAKPADVLSFKHLVLADPASPVGKCSRAYLQRLGIYDQVLAKAVLVDNSRAILAAIRSGRAEAGLAFASDAAKAVDCRLLCAIDPAEAGLAYSAAVCRGPREQDALALLEFFSQPVAQRCFRRTGLAAPQ